MTGNGVFDHIEKTIGKQSADELRSGCRIWIVLFCVASTALAIAIWSIIRTIG